MESPGQVENFFMQNGQTIMMIVAGLAIIGIIAVFLWPATKNVTGISKLFVDSWVTAYKRVTALRPVGVSDNTKLCDYYIASSAYSVFPSSSNRDYVSDYNVSAVIQAGARLVEFDIYADNDDTPVVGLKNEKLGFNYALNSVSFESCCVAVANNAFNTAVKVSSDPFIMSLVFHTDKRNVMDATAEILKNTCGRYLLGPEYAYNNRAKSLAQEPMSKLLGKIIVVSGGNIKGTNIEELVNLSWSTAGLRRLTHMQASQPYDHEELIDANRTNITMVVPDPNPDLKNNNPTILFAYGCQWNLMNYGSLDSMQELNIGKFQEASVILKPQELLYKPVEAKDPALPDPLTHSFQPMAHRSPIYDSNPVTGDKSIVI